MATSDETPKPGRSDRDEDASAIDDAVKAFHRMDLSAPNIDANLANGHALESSWAFWYMKKPLGSRSHHDSGSYEKNMKMLGSFGTVEGFWRFYNHLARPNVMPNNSDYHIFRKGIKPMWEDEANRRGGKVCFIIIIIIIII